MVKKKVSERISIDQILTKINEINSQLPIQMPSSSEA